MHILLRSDDGLLDDVGVHHVLRKLGGFTRACVSSDDDNVVIFDGGLYFGFVLVDGQPVLESPNRFSFHL